MIYFKGTDMLLGNWLHPDFIYVAWQGFKGMLSKISENGDVTAKFLRAYAYFTLVRLFGAVPITTDNQ